MPELNGQEIVAELRNLRAGVPVLISSGYAKEDVMDRFAGCEVSDFIQKPCTVQQLVAEVKATTKGTPPIYPTQRGFQHGA